MPAQSIPTVTITVSTTSGYSFFPLYRDIAGAQQISNASAWGFTATNLSATGFPGGVSFVFHSDANDFVYDPDTSKPIGGTVNSIAIQDSSSNLLVTETGFNINFHDFAAAIDSLNANSDSSGFNSIFNAYRYAASGSNGNDLFLSAANGDLFSGGSGGDWVSYQNAAGAVKANLADGSQDTGEAGGDTFSSIESLRGSNFNDTLIGTAGSNFLRGGNGADWLIGNGGIDTADYNGAIAGVIADFTTPSNNTNEASGDTYSAIANLRGTAFADVLKGDSGNNILTGGAGADRFAYSGGVDTIADFDRSGGSFNHAEADRVDLQTSLIFTWAELQSKISPPGANTVITVSPGNTITLTGVNSADLTAADFVFAQAPSLLVSIGGGMIASGGRALGPAIYSQFLAFGDSSIDTGYFRSTPISTSAARQAEYQLAVDAGGGIPTDLGGRMVSTLLANSFGLSAGPYNAPGGGTNYAASGATITGSLPNSLAPSFVNQVSTYLSATGNVADPNAIYFISASGNSIKIAANLDAVAGAAYMVSEADSMAASLEQLYAAGAKYFVINLSSGGKGLGIAFSNELIADLGAAGVPFVASDVGALVSAINASPASYGITNTDKPPAGPYSPGNPYDSANGGAALNPDPSLITSSWALYATSNVSPVASTAYLWADNEHFATAGHQAEANYIHSLVDNATPVVGQTLTATYTLINGTGTPTFHWQHFVGGSWQYIAGASGATYTVQVTDAGDQLRVEADRGYDGGNSVVVAYSAPTVAASGNATITIVTPAGFNLNGSFADVAAAVRGSFDSTHFDLVNAATHHTFHFTGTGFTGDQNGLTGGTVNEFDILYTPNGSTLVTESGFGIDAVALKSALQTFKDSGDSSELHAIFNPYWYVATGGAGNDTIHGYASPDVLDGGSGGSDTASYAGSAAGVNVSLRIGTAHGGDAEGDMFVNIDNLTGSGFDDTLEGDDGDNVLNGGAGTDTVSYAHSGLGVTVSLALGTAQNTVGAGIDTLSGFENLTGSKHDDVLTGSNSGPNVLTGGAGNDTLNGGGGADMMVGGSGNDTYVVDNAGDVVNESGTDGTDIVQSSLSFSLSDGVHAIGPIENLTLTGASNTTGTGNGLANVITGNAGNNILAGLGGADTLDGGMGSDTASYAASAASVNVSLATGVAHGGDAEGDTFVSIENLIGSGFDDTLEGDSGANVLNGGAGTDTVSYANAAAGVTVSLALGSAQDTFGAGIDTLTSFENLTGSMYDDVLTGSNSTNNTLIGGGGNDMLNGGGGADTMFGGTGNDTYVVDNGGDVVNETGGDGTDTVQSSLSFSLADGVHVIGTVENLTLTGASNTTGTGNGLDNVITGNAGNNILAGLGGADTLDGGIGGSDTASYAASATAVTVSLMTGVALGGDAAGDTFVSIENLTGSAFDDTLEGDSGANVLTGGAGIDTLSYEHAAAGVTVSLALGTAQDTISAGIDTLSGFENLTGTGYDDVLTGSNGAANVLTGGAGNDVLNGGGGADTMFGGTGNDTYVVDNAGDVVNETGGDGIDTVQSSLSFSLADGVHAIGTIENLTLTGASNINGTGNGEDNVITGNSAKNVLSGGNGADTLDGGAGVDTLTGGAGNDAFVFHLPTDGVDTITDFASGADFLQIFASGFGGGLVAGNPVILVSASSNAAATSGSGGYFIFDNAGANQGTVYWDANGGSGSDAVAIATLQGVSSLLPSDFHVV